MVTIKDVAKEAGVSVATVSRVINNDTKVADATRTRVNEAIKQLNYQPNLVGRNLRTACTNKILVLLPSISNQFYSRIIVSMESAAEEIGYELLLCVTSNNPMKERKYLEMLHSQLVDAAVFLSSSLAPNEFNQLTNGYPVVQCCEFFDGAKTPIVSIDNEQAGFDAAEFLISLGHKRIAFFGNNDRYMSALLRLNGFRKSLARHGIPDDCFGVYSADYSFKSGRETFLHMQHTLNGSLLPTAIFCVSDSIAIGVMNEAASQGIKIGTELSVMGFDNTAVSEVCTPPLTTVSQPRADIGHTAIQLLSKKLIEKRGKNTKVFLPHEIVIRDSTGPVLL
ncbi:MAG: LacI family transcriptional regulator [Ruminococcaceae bacterium]|nr:LacI family transcriptional regulator [Oscillospiraceae bacterium]